MLAIIEGDALRIGLLNMVHRIRGAGARSSRDALTFDFGGSAVRIVPNASPSLNLVVSALR